MDGGRWLVTVSYLHTSHMFNTKHVSHNSTSICSKFCSENGLMMWPFTLHPSWEKKKLAPKNKHKFNTWRPGIFILIVYRRLSTKWLSSMGYHPIFTWFRRYIVLFSRNFYLDRHEKVPLDPIRKRPNLPIVMRCKPLCSHRFFYG